MLNEHNLEFTYREYTEDPLSADEIRKVFAKLKLEPEALVRKNDKAYKALELRGDESADEWIELMADHPTLLQRPIGVKGRKAVVGRPIENLLELE